MRIIVAKNITGSIVVIVVVHNLHFMLDFPTGRGWDNFFRWYRYPSIPKKVFL